MHPGVRRRRARPPGHGEGRRRCAVDPSLKAQPVSKFDTGKVSKFDTEKDNIAFNLNLVFLSLRLYTMELMVGWWVQLPPSPPPRIWFNFPNSGILLCTFQPNDKIRCLALADGCQLAVNDQGGEKAVHAGV